MGHSDEAVMAFRRIISGDQSCAVVRMNPLG
jgi:hypothetical protein